MEFSNIPGGSKLTVSETDYTGDKGGYDHPVYTFIKEDGTSVGTIDPDEYEIKEDGPIVITNNKDVDIDTGVSLSSVPFVLMFTLSVLGFAGMLFRRRRESR